VSADGQARIKVAEDKVGHDADLVGTLLEKSTGSDADGDGDGDGDGTGRDYPVMMKVDTEGFSALAVQARDGHVLVGLSDCSIAIIDLTREVTLHVYRGHEDLVRGAVCLMDKGLLITAGWDHSVRVWLLQVIVERCPNRRALPQSSSAAPLLCTSLRCCGRK
jgi:WD40 repeat protein